MIHKLGSKKAGNDLQYIRNNLLLAVVPWDVIAYHAQQAAEKSLKAALGSRGAEVPRSHDLGRLLGECLVIGLHLRDVEEQCNLLTPYAIASRYPGDEPEITEADARAAYDAAQIIFGGVAALVKAK